jgi:hypothetical protein
VPFTDDFPERPGPLTRWSRALARRLRGTAEWAAGDAPHRPAGLHVCTGCGGDFVNPIEWMPSDERHWWIRLRCGQCGSRREVVVTDAVAERFDRELDARMLRIADALDRIDREHMAVQAEAMIGALRRGLIDASDFAA